MRLPFHRKEENGGFGSSLARTYERVPRKFLVKTTTAFLGGAAFGVSLMYIADPILGKRRRAIARDAAVHSAKIAGRAIDITSRDMTHRLKGVFEETKSLFKHEPIDDEILADRVRTAVGRVSSHPNVEVLVENGCVTLLGPIVDREERQVLKAAKSVKGVCGVVNRMKPHQPLDLTATQASREQQLDIMQRHWSPATRIIVGAIGISAAASGIRGGVSGALTRVVGLNLLLRAATNIEFKRLVGFKAGWRAVDIQKTIKIAAPIERVYSLWKEYENFPLFMSRIQEVRDLGNARSHWIVIGPLGARLEWDAVITEMIPNKLLAWESEPGSLIQHAGMVRFDSEKDHTRVQVRLSYNPPAGAIGHAIATLLGSNPEQEMDKDLVRMQTFIETAKRPHDAVRKLA
jgi:uncharacterized membrane protein